MSSSTWFTTAARCSGCSRAGAPSPSWCRCRHGWSGATTGSPSRAARKRSSTPNFWWRRTGYKAAAFPSRIGAPEGRISLRCGTLEPAFQRFYFRQDSLVRCRGSDFVRVCQVRVLLERLVFRERGLGVLLELVQIHRLVDETEDLRLIDEIDHELGIGGFGQNDDQNFRALVLEDFERRERLFTPPGDIGDDQRRLVGVELPDGPIEIPGMVDRAGAADETLHCIERLFAGIDHQH